MAHHSASTPSLSSKGRPQSRGGSPADPTGAGGESTMTPTGSAAGGLPRPQSSPAGDLSGGLGSSAGSTPSRPHTRQGPLQASASLSSFGSGQKKTPPPLYKRSLPLYFDGYRKKESAALGRIEYSPIVQLYPGNKAGGTVSSLHAAEHGGPGLESGATAESRNAPKVFERFPEFQDQFHDVVRRCTANQKETRGLWRQMKRGEEIEEKEAAALQDKLRIMQSMPDISMPTKEFELFIKNAMEQQKALDREMSGQFNSDTLSGMNKHRGSIRHIFPLRNVRTGRVAKGERATIWRV